MYPVARRRFWGAVTSLGLAAGLVAGCSSGGAHHSTTELHGTIAIGVLAPLSGPDAAVGKDLVHGASLAVDEINAGPGVLGHRVRLDVQDDGCAVGQAASAAARLVQAHVVGVVGGVCNAAATAAATALGRAGVPMLVTSADSDTLAGVARPTTFMLNGTVHQQGLAAFHWIAYNNAQRVAVVADSSAESAELSGVVVNSLSVPLARRLTVQPGQDMSAVVPALLSSHPDFLYWAGSAHQGGQLLRALRVEGGYQGKFLASAAADSPALVATAGRTAAEGAYITTLARPALLTGVKPSGAKAWVARYQAKYHQAPGRAGMQAFDGVGALAQGVRLAGATGSKAISNSLAGIHGFSTFLGPLQFAPDHTLINDNYVVAVVRHGVITLASALRSD